MQIKKYKIRQCWPSQTKLPITLIKQSMHENNNVIMFGFGTFEFVYSIEKVWH